VLQVTRTISKSPIEFKAKINKGETEEQKFADGRMERIA
jgi:hypothetical protein